LTEVLYVYGFVPAGTRSPERLEGMDDSRVELVAVSPDVAAAVSRVSAERWAPERIEARLEDLRWVADQGVAHERVVAWFVDRGDIVPVPLFTFYSGKVALEEDVAERATEILARLERFRGRREWDLKVAYRAERALAHAAELSDAVRALDDELAAAPPGRRYLLERKRAELARAEIAGAARRRAAGLLDSLRPLADEVVQLPLPRNDPALPVVLNAALLVPKPGEAALIAAAEAGRAELDGLGLEVVFSGPWAPYRFVGDDI
jgi:Gas vesicle synthesis protein GvpL/GvpF